MRLSNYEKETIINWNKEETTASVYTHEQSIIRKLDAMSRIDSSVVVLRRGEGWAEYKIPKKWVKVVKPRQYSDEQLEVMRARARAMQERNNNNA